MTFDHRAIIATLIFYAAVALIANVLACQLWQSAPAGAYCSGSGVPTLGLVWPFAVYIGLFTPSPGPVWAGIVSGTAFGLFLLAAFVWKLMRWWLGD